MLRTKVAVILLACLSAFGATVSQVHYDTSQTGVNTTETSITSANVTSLVQTGAWPIVGYVSAQPLYVPSIGGKNLLIAATWNGNIYAFDADHSATTVWSRNFANARLSYPSEAGAFPNFYSAPIGIVSTPYVDVSGGFVYVVNQNTTPQYTLYQLSLSTGAILQSVVISGSVTGTGDTLGGDCVTGGVLSFCPNFQFVQRPGLVVANGNVYIAFGSTDVDPYHGWVFAYNTSTFARTAVWCSTPNGAGGSVWMSGAAPAVDGSGNLYFTTGNGDYDGITNFGESVVKLSSTLTVLDWFTPSNWATLNTGDEDVSANHLTLIPSTTKAMFAAKDYQAYVIDTGGMGHLQGSGAAPQTWQICSGCTKGKSTGGYGQIYMGGVWYLATSGLDADHFGGTAAGSLYAFTFGGSTFTSTPVATNVNTWPFPGPAQIAGSSNSGSNQIVWVITGDSQAFTAPSQGTLRAFDTTLTELWNSGSTLGLMSKYTAPTIANGSIYVATQSGFIYAYAPLTIIHSTLFGGSAIFSGKTTQ